MKLLPFDKRRSSRRKKKSPPRQHNSTIREPSHKEKLLASQRLRSTTPVKKKNEERLARKAVSYRQGMARYKKSETYKQVEARAGGMCEVQTDADFILGRISTSVTPIRGYVRCDNRRADGIQLQHHHLTYMRFGGDELPEDICVACKSHHRLIEQLRGKSEKRFWRVG